MRNDAGFAAEETAEYGAGQAQRLGDLRQRTRQLALRVIRLYRALPKAVEAQVIGKQLPRAGTSVGAQYREAYRAKSDPDFVSKTEGALQELEETAYWIELVQEAGLMRPQRLAALQNEIAQLTAILVAVVLKVKRRSACPNRTRPHQVPTQAAQTPT